MDSIAGRGLLTRRSDGFTIIELMTVVMVIGILAVMIIPNYVKFADRAKEALVKENMHVVRSGMELYAIDHVGAYPQQANEAELQGLMPGQTFPRNPFNKAVTDIAWDADPSTPGEISIIGLAGGGFMIKGHGRDRVLDLVLSSGD